MKHVLITFTTLAILVGGLSPTAAMTDEELKAAQKPLRSDEIAKVQKAGRAVLKARKFGRDKENFRRNKETLKIVRRELRRLKRDLTPQPSITVVPAGQAQLSEEEKAKQENAKRKARKEKRKRNLENVVARLRGLETDYRERKIAKRKKKIQKKIERMELRSDVDKEARLNKLRKKLDKLNRKQNRLAKKSAKKLKKNQASNKTDIPLEVDNEEGSKMNQMANELAALYDAPRTEQLKKINELLKRSGAVEGALKPQRIEKEPGFRTKAHHRYPIQ